MNIDQNIDQNEIQFGALKKWTLCSPEKFWGTVTSAQIESLLRNQEIGLDSQVWSSEEEEWKPLANFSQFRFLVMDLTRHKIQQANNSPVHISAMDPNLREFNSFGINATATPARDVNSNGANIDRTQFADLKIENINLDDLALDHHRHTDQTRNEVSITESPFKGESTFEVKSGTITPDPWEVLREEFKLKSEEFLYDMKSFDGNHKKAVRKKLWLSFFAGSVVALGIYGLTQVLQAHPNWQQLTIRENAELAAIIRLPSSLGPIGGSFLFNRDIKRPQFLLVSNLKNGKEVKIYLEGVKETLVGSTQYSVESTGKMESGYLTTPHPETELPKGFYKLSLIDLESGMKIHEKEFFLGGEKDSDYENQLRSYHSLLAQRASEELLEFKQIAETLKSELYNYAGMIGTPDQSTKASVSRQQETQKLLFQINDILLTWKMKDQNRQVFYKDLYKLVNASFQNVQQALTQGKYQKFSDIQPSLSLITQILFEVDRLQKKPLTPNGMPQE